MTTYDARQCSLPNSPASTTPAEMPTPRLAPQAALARARSWPGVVASARTASPQARTAAPPMPWTTRAATKSPVPSASTHATAPRPSTTSPPTSVRRRPMRSPTAPVASSVAASPMLIELITQARAPPPPCRSASVSATVAIGVT